MQLNDAYFKKATNEIIAQFKGLYLVNTKKLNNQIRQIVRDAVLEQQSRCLEVCHLGFPCSECMNEIEIPNA